MTFRCELVDRVARAIFANEHGSDGAYTEYAGYYRQAANVAISVVIEEVDALVDRYQPDAGDLMAAIRALAQPQDGEGKG